MRWPQTSVDSLTLSHRPYARDALYRLIGAQSSPLTAQSYSYDPVGNRLTSSNANNWTYNQNNELQTYNGVTFQYDLNGNTTQKNDNGAIQNFVYNEDDRLTEVKDGNGAVVATYYYDPFGRRLWKEVGGTRTYFMYADEGLIAEMDGSGSQTKSYGYAPNSTWTTDPLFMKQEGEYFFYHNDHLGTPQKMTAVNGSVVWSSKYESFGKAVIDPASSVENNLRFPGQYYDAEIGLHYNYHRYYDPKIGRYLRRDPIGLSAGINPYLYVNGNSIIAMDPQGLFTSGGPAPSSVIGTCDYYLWRHNDFIQRNGCNSSPPSYYLEYGYKYCLRFKDITRPTLTLEGQRWLDRTLILLQRYMEERIIADPVIEADNDRFTDMAFDTHPDAYWDAGLYDLPLSDKLKILDTPDKQDLLSERGRKQFMDIVERHVREFKDRNF